MVKINYLKSLYNSVDKIEKRKDVNIRYEGQTYPSEPIFVKKTAKH